MGYWGTGPFDNDMAADWLCGLWEGSKIPEMIGAALESDYDGEIRAAASILINMSEYWPVDTTLLYEKAIIAYEKLLKKKNWAPEFKKEIKKELKKLRGNHLVNSIPPQIRSDFE